MTQLGEDGEEISKIMYPELQAPVMKKKVVHRKVGKKKSNSNKQSKTEKENIKECGHKYDVLSELSNVSRSLTFGQLLRGDAGEAKRDINLVSL